MNQRLAIVPQAGTMLALCSIGALAGLVLDCLAGSPVLFGALCLSGPISLGRHWAAMPWTMVGMALGGLAALAASTFEARRRAAPWRHAIGGRAGFNIACHGTMLAAMMPGPIFAPLWGAFGTVIAMLATMAVAITTVAVFYRLVLPGTGVLR